MGTLWTPQVVSLEVGEHVPPMFEGMVLRNLHAHNCRGLVLSWAKLRQAGHGHVNNHMPEYIAAKLHALGYFVNENVTRFLRTGRQRDPQASALLDAVQARLRDAGLPVVRQWFRHGLPTITAFERYTPVRAPGCTSQSD